MNASKQIVVIGGGVIGLCSAYYLAQRGHRVTLVERHGSQRDGCSYGNAGMIVPSHFIPLAAPGMVGLGLKWMWNPQSPFYIKPRLDRDLFDWGAKFWRASTKPRVARAAPVLRDLQLASRACFEELAAKTHNDFGLVQKGLLVLCRTQHALDEEAKTAAQARALGIPADLLDARQTAGLEPNLRMTIAGSVYFPQDCHLTPARFMASMARQLAELGVEFRGDTEVTGARVAHRRIEALQTSNGDVPGDEFVLATGSWSQQFGRALSLNLPMQAGKGYSLTLDRPPELPEICAILTEARIAMTPMSGALRFGGTMEIAGLDERINPLRVQGIINAVPKYFPDFTAEDFAGVRPWAGLRPCSPDGLPYVGRTAQYANLSVGTGHAMMGLSLGPITGKLIAEIVSEELPSLDIRLLSPDRYVRE